MNLYENESVLSKKIQWLLSVLNKNETDELMTQFECCQHNQLKIGQFKDFSQTDKELATAILETVDINTIDNSKIISYQDKNFVLATDDFNRLSSQQRNQLKRIAETDTSLHNPIYVSIEDDNTLIID